MKTQVNLNAGKLIADGLIPGVALIEVKYSFVADAYRQLQEYTLALDYVEREPVARNRQVVICKNYDPSVRLPVCPMILQSLHGLDDINSGFYVYIWSRYDGKVFE